MRVVVPVCCAVWIATFVASLDGTIAAMLLGSISASFRASEQASWIGSSYLLSVCCVSPLYGRLGDIIGRRRSFVVALTLFTLGTFLCGRATSMSAFLFARTLTGLGGGGLSTVGNVIMSHLVPLKNRGILQGLTNIVFGLGAGTGAPFGGWLNDAIGWRGAFYVQLPFLALAVVFTFLFIEHDEPGAGGETLLSRLLKMDVLGVGSFTVMLLAALGALSGINAEGRGPTHPSVLANAALALVALVAFCVVERRYARMPVLLMDEMGTRTVGCACWANFALSVSGFAYNYYFPLFFQVVGGLKPATIGTRMVPTSVCISIGSLAAGFWMRHKSRFYKYNTFCAALAFAALLPACFYSSEPPTVLPFALNPFWSFGQSGVLTCTLIALINSVTHEHVGAVTGMSYLFRTTGQVLGVSAAGELMQWLLTQELRRRIKGKHAAQLIARILHQSSVIPTLEPGVRAAAEASYAVALHAVFVLVAVAAGGTLVLCALVRDEPLASDPTDEALRELANEEGETQIE